MHTLDTTGIFKPYLTQDIASPFEEVLNAPAINALFFIRNTHYLNNKDVVRYPQTYQQLPPLNTGHTDRPGSQDPFCSKQRTISAHLRPL